ncbi:MAG TPA: hypothetical protein VNG51_21705 [Ktedonobacteraceae bacterium]|nr:hypothetical protein [Ktedonobacteraceae bacterium]
MNKQAQVFARQVQLDLLALSDADLFKIVHVWVIGKPIGLSADIYSEARLALGYTLTRGEPSIPSNAMLAGNTFEAEEQWLAPSLPKLRQLLTDMDVKFFVQYVLPLAFQSLHTLHPEWDEGATFNAHLANYLRSIGGKQRHVTREPGEKEVLR